MIQELPSQVLKIVFSHISAKKLRPCFLVCKQFYNVFTKEEKQNMIKLYKKQKKVKPHYFINKIIATPQIYRDIAQFIHILFQRLKFQLKVIKFNEIIDIIENVPYELHNTCFVLLDFINYLNHPDFYRNIDKIQDKLYSDNIEFTIFMPLYIIKIIPPKLHDKIDLFLWNRTKYKAQGQQIKGIDNLVCTNAQLNKT